MDNQKVGESITKDNVNEYSCSPTDHINLTALQINNNAIITGEQVQK